MSPAGMQVDVNGCADSQRDDDSDAINNDVDQCPDTEVGMITNSVGCADVQLDDDNDMIDNTVELCLTPAGQQVDSVECAESQLDQDNDSIRNHKDLCPDTDESHSIDLDGCSEYQLDDDEDGVKNIDDDCPRTPTSSIVFDDGCALSEMDSDKDNVNDTEDDFRRPHENETTDSDGDGISDTYDYYPGIPTNQGQEASDGGADWYTQGIAPTRSLQTSSLLIVRKNQQLPTESSPFAEQNYLDASTESNMSFESSKELPEIQVQNQQWEGKRSVMVKIFRWNIALFRY